jgi:hypothetical protein
MDAWRPKHVEDYDTIKCLWKWKCIKFVGLLVYIMIHGQKNIKSKFHRLQQRRGCPKYEVSWKSLQYKPIFSQKDALFSMWAPLILYRSQTNLQRLQRMCGMCDLVTVQENPSKWSRDAAEGVLAPPSKVFLILNQTQPNLHRFSAWMEIARYEVSAKSLQWQPRYNRKGTLHSK